LLAILSKTENQDQITWSVYKNATYSIHCIIR